MAKKKTSTSDPVTAYADGVASGAILAGPHVRHACERHLRDLQDGASRGLVWDVRAANHVIGFFEDVLCLNGGEFEGQPFLLLDWQQFIVGSLFGWKTSDGFRRFRMAYIESGKGSGKSPLVAGIGIYMLCADHESRAEVYAAAQKKDQAKVLFRDAVAMVELSPALSSRLHLGGKQEKHNIAHPDSGSFFKPISTEERGRGQSGPRPHCALLDEIHEHSTNAMVEFMRAGTKGRRQALICMITNSGSDRESVCYDYHDYAAKVAANQLQDDSFFGYVCALDTQDDPFEDETCWGKANPSLGKTFTTKYLAEQVRQARGIPSKQNLVLRLNFCRWTDAESPWISKDVWERCEAELNLEDYRGRVCLGGLDLSSRRDLTALALLFPCPDGSVDAFVEFWTPQETMRMRGEQDRVPYDAWSREGFLHAVPGRTVDYAFLCKRFAELQSEFDLRAIRYDRWRIEELKREFEKEGLDLPLLECGQGFKDMAPAVDTLEQLIVGGKFRVQINPVLRWNIASAVTEEDPAGNKKFTKRKATGRIDGAVALAMATAQLVAEPVEFVTDHALFV